MALSRYYSYDGNSGPKQSHRVGKRGREIKRENERSVSTAKTACKAGTGTMVRLIRLMNTCRARIIVCLSA